MNNFWTRTISGIVFVVLVVGVLLWDPLAVFILFLFIALGGLWEFFHMFGRQGDKSIIIPAFLLSVLVFLGLYLQSMGIKNFMPDSLMELVPYISALVSLILILELFREKIRRPAASAITPMGVIYAVFPMASWMLIICFHGFFPWYFLGFIIIIWCNDTFAYLVGRTLGRTKLFERISPKKTWEGTIGGFVFSMAAGYVLSIYREELSPIQWMTVGAVASVTGTLGDLVESMFKRSAGVKDSGRIMPGHGGILDRFDAVLIASPFVVCYLLYIRHFVD